LVAGTVAAGKLRHRRSDTGDRPRDPSRQQHRDDDAQEKVDGDGDADDERAPPAQSGGILAEGEALRLRFLDENVEFSLDGLQELATLGDRLGEVLLGAAGLRLGGAFRRLEPGAERCLDLFHERGARVIGKALKHDPKIIGDRAGERLLLLRQFLDQDRIA
jgi:hypothetical protein